MVVEVIDAHVDGALAVFELLVEVDAGVHAVVGRHAVVVARLDVGHHRAVFALILAKSEGGHVACAVNPGERAVDALVELVHEHDGNVVATVVFGGELPAVVYLLSLAVEDAVGVAPGVADPAGELAYVALDEELDTVAPPTPHADFVLPADGAAPEGGAVAVFHEVVHIFVVALDREVGDAAPAVHRARRHLMGLHGFDPRGHGHPEVGGKADGGVGEQVHILRHPRVAHLEREVGRDEETSAQSRLDGGVELMLHIEAAEVHAAVYLHRIGDAPIVLDVGVELLGVHDALPYDGVHIVLYLDACVVLVAVDF